MSRVLSYISDIRQELADPKQERWSDNRLLSLLSDAQTELAHELRCLISRVSISVIAGIREYTLPDDADTLLRVYSTDGQIEKCSHYDMDMQNPTWEAATGQKVERVIYDLLTPNRIILYPTPAQDDSVAAYTFEDGDGGLFVGSERLGVVTSIDNYTFNRPFGVVTNLFEPGITEVFNSPFGVVSDIRNITTNLVVQYARRPKPLTSMYSTLELSEAFKLAMVHLTCFRALSADIDAKSAQLASTHFNLYNVQLKRLQGNASMNQTRGNTGRTIHRDVL